MMNPDSVCVIRPSLYLCRGHSMLFPSHKYITVLIMFIIVHLVQPSSRVVGRVRKHFGLGV